MDAAPPPGPDATLVSVLAYAGLRPGETLALRVVYAKVVVYRCGVAAVARARVSQGFVARRGGTRIVRSPRYRAKEVLLDARAAAKHRDHSAG